MKLVDNETDEWFIETPRQNTVKTASPFTKVFLSIEREAIIKKLSNFSENLLFNIEFVNFLQNNFMPYIFLWAGFVFRGIQAKDKNGETITHVTQGSIEK